MTAKNNQTSSHGSSEAGVSASWWSWGLGLLAVLLAVGAGLWIYWPQLTGQEGPGGRDVPGQPAADAPAEVTAVVARRMDFALRSEATGHLAPLRSAQLSPKRGGQVIERPVQEGDYVGEGGLLFALDRRDEQIAVEEARGVLLKAQAEYASEVGLQTEMAGENADTTRLARARADYLAAQKRFRQGAIERAALKEARRWYEALKLIGGGNSSRIRAARTGLLQAEQQLARARLQLQQTKVRAPFGGRVADLEVEVGDYVSGGQPQLKLLADRQMTVRVEALESDLVHLEPGGSATVRIPALGDSLLTGRIRTVNPRVDPATGTGRVTVAVPNPRGDLVSGLYASVELETRRLEDRLVVPENALLIRQGRDLVFVIENGRAQWTYVEVGPRSSGFAVIGEGLSAGDTVAVDGHFALGHDAAVSISLKNRPYLEIVESPGQVVAE